MSSQLHLPSEYIKTGPAKMWPLPNFEEQIKKSDSMLQWRSDDQEIVKRGQQRIRQFEYDDANEDRYREFPVYLRISNRKGWWRRGKEKTCATREDQHKSPSRGSSKDSSFTWVPHSLKTPRDLKVRSQMYGCFDPNWSGIIDCPRYREFHQADLSRLACNESDTK